MKLEINKRYRIRNGLAVFTDDHVSENGLDINVFGRFCREAEEYTLIYKVSTGECHGFHYFDVVEQLDDSIQIDDQYKPDDQSGAECRQARANLTERLRSIAALANDIADQSVEIRDVDDLDGRIMNLFEQMHALAYTQGAASALRSRT